MGSVHGGGVVQTQVCALNQHVQRNHVLHKGTKAKAGIRTRVGQTRRAKKPAGKGCFHTKDTFIALRCCSCKLKQIGRHITGPHKQDAIRTI